MRRRTVRLIGAAFGALALTIAAAVVFAYQRYTREGPLASETWIVIPKGSSLIDIARKLSEGDVIADPWIFALGARHTGAARGLKAGEYAFHHGMSMSEVAAVISSGRTVQRRFTVAESLTSAEILALLAETEGIQGPSPALPGEGTLLPETYFYSHGDTPAELIVRMMRAMRETIAELWPGRAPDLPISTPAEAIVLASIVEKETGLGHERARVAAVFLNRLRRGMKLQADPTVVYAVTEGKRALERPLSRADLELRSPYNTYVVPALPPGPIANPGRSSIAAVLRPASTNELYFVADGRGGHVFARSLEEHNRNVARLRARARESRDDR